MNKWSLLLFSVLGLLLSTTSELNFVDGRLGCCDRSSRPLLSDTRLSIDEPHCASQTFTEKNQLISPQRDIPHASRNVELKLPSGSDGRREQFVGRRISSYERFRTLSNVVFDLEDSALSNARDRKALREINDVQLRRNLKYSRDNFRENHVDRSRSRNNDFLGNKMERNSRERGVNIEEELSEIWDNRFRHNDGPVSSNLKDRKQERFNRRTFVIRTNIMPSPRENIDEIRLRLIKKNDGKKEIEWSNLNINTRQRLFRDTRLTSDSSENSDRRFKKDERITKSDSKIDILRNRNIRDYRRLSVREDSIEKMYERESLTDVRRNTDMYGTVNVYRRNYDKDISEEILERINSKNVVIRIQNKRFTRRDKSSSRPRTIQREKEGSRNLIREDERQMNNDFETRLSEKRYSTRRLPRQNTNINRLQEIRQARFYNDIIIEDGRTDYSNVFIERTERASYQSRNIRENNREIRIREEYMAERITPRNINCLVEKRAVNSNINKRRSEAIRRSVLERRERDSSRYRLDHENENNFDLRRIRQITNSHNEDKLREARNTQQKMIRNNAMGQEINNIRQVYDDDNVSQGFLVRDDNNKKLASRLERDNLSSPGERASQIRINQRDNQNKMNIRAINLQENGFRIQADSNYNRRLVSNANTNIEKRRARTYNEKSDREEFRNSLIREAERAFDESRIRQVRDKHEYRREYRSNVERADGRVLSRVDRNRNNDVESGFVRIISSIGKNRIYGITRIALTVLRRRENDEVKYWSAHENERILDQRRTRDVLERRENDLSNERLAQRNLSAPRNSKNNAMLNKNRRSYNDENNSQVTLVSTNQREIIKRSETERYSAVIKRSSFLRMIQREHENRIRNDYTQPMHIQENRLRRERWANRCLAGQDSYINRIVEDRRAGTPKETSNTLRLIRSVDESRISQLRDSREYRLNEKRNAERVLERNINKIIEKRESRIRHEFDVNDQNKKTKRTLILLQLREKDVPSLIRVNERDCEQNGNGIVRNKREFTGIEDHSRNIQVAERHGLRNINERSNIRGTRNNLITRYIATEVEFHDSDETHHERRTERVIRIARHRVSIINRDLQEARSEKQRDVNRDLEYIRHVRNYNGLENRAHRENKENVKTSDRDNNRGRDARDKARDTRSSNGLRISKTVSRITKTRRTNEEELEMRTAFSKIRYLPIEQKNQSDNEMFKIKLQYIFYMLQGLYILGLFTKFTINSDGIQKRTRFSNWFPLFSTLKVH